MSDSMSWTVSESTTTRCAVLPEPDLRWNSPRHADRPTGHGMELDLQLSKVFRVGRVQLVPIVSVFNAIPHESIYYSADWSEKPGYRASETYKDGRAWEIGFRVEF